MRTEVLELKRACFCLPLRYSLLFCGYSRLILIILNWSMTYAVINFEDSSSVIYWEIYSTTTEFLDFILVIVFIVGAHKKSVKLLKVFYFYDLGLLILETLMCAAFVIYMLCETLIPEGFGKYVMFNVKIMLSIAAYLAICLVFKGYVLLLVRSEIFKLSNNSQFRFVNNAAESECTMEYKKTDDEEQGLAKNDESFETKDDCSDSVDKLKNDAECNMKYKKLDEEGIGTETIGNEGTCNSKVLVETRK